VSVLTLLMALPKVEPEAAVVFMNGLAVLECAYQKLAEGRIELVRKLLHHVAPVVRWADLSGSPNLQPVPKKTIDEVLASQPAPETFNALPHGLVWLYKRLQKRLEIPTTIENTVVHSLPALFKANAVLFAGSNYDHKKLRQVETVLFGTISVASREELGWQTEGVPTLLRLIESSASALGAKELLMHGFDTSVENALERLSDAPQIQPHQMTIFPFFLALEQVYKKRKPFMPPETMMVWFGLT
jgi:hypothetical protein